jgi:nitroreductase
VKKPEEGNTEMLRTLKLDHAELLADRPPLPATLAQFEQLALRRRSVRRFRPDPLPHGLLERLLDIARWAPSGYNLQPTHFFVVDSEAARQRLCPAAMNQKHVLQAPVTVVFAGDRRVYENDFERILDEERSIGGISLEYEGILRRVVPLAMRAGPLGLNCLWKAILVALGPIVRLVAPLPQIPAVEHRAWHSKQASLAAMNFMLAATAAGLSTIPMEGFDEKRVRRACRIPGSFDVILLVSVGYADDTPRPKSRLPLEDRVHHVSAA